MDSKKQLTPTYSVDAANRQYITDWLVIGPFSPADLTADFLTDIGGESAAQPQAGDTVGTADGRTLMWKGYQAESHVVELCDVIGEAENAIAYAYCTLYCQMDCTATLYLSGMASVWLNGMRSDFNSPGSVLVLDDIVITTHLNAGVNRLLVKRSTTKFFHRRCCDIAVRLAVLPTERAQLSGVITDTTSNRVRSALVRVEQNGSVIAQTMADESGNYRIDIFAVGEAFDLSATADEQGCWQYGLSLRADEHRILNLTLRDAVSISGKLLEGDNVTPHVATPVEAVRIDDENSSKRPTITLSDDAGVYRFVSLKAGRYRVRCQTQERLVESDEIFQLGQPFENVDFRLASVKKGTWKRYTVLDGLGHNDVRAICTDANGYLWFGTWGGRISRFDGETFNSSILKFEEMGDGATAIYCDAAGVLWFGTFAGVVRYNGQETMRLTVGDGLGSDNVYAIGQAQDGTMWFEAAVVFRATTTRH